MYNFLDFISSAPLISISAAFLTIVSFIISISSLIMNKLQKKIEIKIGDEKTVIKGSEKESQKQIEKLADEFFESFKDREVDHELKTWDNIGEDHGFIHMINSLKDVISSLVGANEIWFSLRKIDGETVKTVYSSRDKNTPNFDDKRNTNINHTTDFYNIIKGDEFFFCSIMQEYAKDFKYSNGNPNWFREFNSSVVVPVIINDKVKGFFCMYGKEELKRIHASEFVLVFMKKAAEYIATLVEDN